MMVGLTARHVAYAREDPTGARREYLFLTLTLASVNEQATVHAPLVADEDATLVDRCSLTMPYRFYKVGKNCVSLPMVKTCAARIVRRSANAALARHALQHV